MKKLEKRSTVTCFMCHEGGHKSYECKIRKKKEGKEKSTTSNASTMKAKEKKMIKKKTSTFNTHTKKTMKGRRQHPIYSRKAMMERWLPTRLVRITSIVTNLF